MARLPKVSWNAKEQCWRSKAVGPYSEATGRRIGVRNRDIGPPTGRDGAANRARAEQWLSGLVAQEANATRTATDPSLEELAETYLAWCAPRVAKRTLDGYRWRLNAFCSEVDSRGVLYGKRVVKTLGPADVSRVARLLRSRDCAPVWVRDVTQAARVCTAWAARKVADRSPLKILSEDPFEDSETVEVEAPPKRYAGADMRREFFGACFVRLMGIDPEAHPLTWRFDRLAVALWRFAESTGCRPDEACRLEWAHIDWADQVATMRGKSGRRRVPLPGSVLRMLKAIYALPGRHDVFVFTHRKHSRQPDPANRGDLAGAPWVPGAIAQKLRKWRDQFIAQGVMVDAEGTRRFSLYQLRRDVGADILRLTGSHAESAEVLGHSAEVNAKYYASFENRRAVGLAEKLEKSRRGETRGSTE